MADTAAFFAKKKKGKKKIKSFNANKVDVSAVSTTIHVDAPPIASHGTGTHTHQKDDIAPAEDDEWASMPVSTSTKHVVVATQKSNAVSELLDMSVLEERRREEDDILERMEVEETRMALAKAREGMEKEAQRLKEEQEAKEQKKAANAAPLAAPSSSTGGKWIPPHLRNAPARQSSATQAKRFGSGLNTSDEEAFPDLAAANAELERQKLEEQKLAQAKAKKKQQQEAAAQKNQPVHGASYASAIKELIRDEAPPPRKPVVPSKEAESTTAPTESIDTHAKDFKEKLVMDKEPNVIPPTPNTENFNIAAPEDKTKSLPEAAAVETKETPVVVVPDVPLAKAVEKPAKTEVKKKKKKKKDLSTFKPS